LTISVTLADANILISRTLRDYFVYAARLGALDIHWSETILDETTRNLIKQFDFIAEDAEVLVERLEAFLPSGRQGRDGRQGPPRPRRRALRQR